MPSKTEEYLALAQQTAKELTHPVPLSCFVRLCEYEAKSSTKRE